MGSADVTATATGTSSLVGSEVAGRYRILELMSEGAMGVVYAAWHMGLDQRVAFKVLRRGSDGRVDPVARQRFQREARAAARVQSDYMCRVLDTGELDDDTPFLVMEYLEGCDLEAELAARGPLPVHEAVHYIRQACAALAEAHLAGIVHRDLKPANLFLQDTADALLSGAASRRLKLLDFGISKSSRAQEANVSLTRTSTLLGSPIYMSPEQLNSSRDVDARGDVWALGVILYELVTGARPFEASSIAQLVNAVLHRPPTPCARHGVRVPAELEQILERALQKDREQRYQSVVELAAVLAPFEIPLHSDVGGALVPGSMPAWPPRAAATHRSRAEPRASTTISLHQPARGTMMPSRPPRGLLQTAWLALLGAALGVALVLGLRVVFLHDVSRAAAPPVFSPPALGADGLAAPAQQPTAPPLVSVPVRADAPRPWDIDALPLGELPPEEPWSRPASPVRLRRDARPPASAPPEAAVVYQVSDFGGRR